MATVPCPTCGLPRAEDLVGVTACPICGATGASAPEPEPLPEPAPVAAGPIADVRPDAVTGGGSRIGVGIVVFVLGIAVGAAGLFGWQTVVAPWLEPPDPAASPPVATAGPSTPAPEARTPAIAPPPREVVVRP